MKKTMVRCLMTLVMIVSMVLITACPKSESGGTSADSTQTDRDGQSLAVAVVAGWRTGNNEISVNTQEITDIIYDSCYSSGYVSFARVDGNPEQYLKVNIPEPEVDGLSEAKLKSIAEGYRDEIFAVFNECGAAKYPEADTLEAIRMEASALRETGAETDKYLVVIDSGLSTTGYLNFCNDLFNAETEDIISKLEQEQAIPDLSGIHITWLYCGEVAEPQEKLSEVQKNKIKEIYGAIFEAGNAADYVFREDIPTATPYRNLPDVSTVAADERIIEVPPMETIILDSSQVSFVGDEATFLEPSTARKAIKTAADSLAANPKSKVFVAGSTAGMDGESKWCKELSEARAAAVVSVLEEYGISANRLIPIGLGSNAPWHITDVDSNGNWIEEKAQKNRCVYIVDVNDPEYGNILSAFHE